jgi:hypothetical protein
MNAFLGVQDALSPEEKHFVRAACGSQRWRNLAPLRCTDCARCAFGGRSFNPPRRAKDMIAERDRNSSRTDAGNVGDSLKQRAWRSLGVLWMIAKAFYRPFQQNWS